MQTLSPRKFVQTTARTLPVGKCMVNKDWEESQIANVSVMRKHANGNVTVGLYRVDLLCLGIKDTVFFFNTSEDEFMSAYGQELTEFREIDYALAHNIVYGGHDFALEFDIHPHHNFEVTRFILEADDQAVPVIEVPLGTDGYPHLIVEKAGEFSDILAKLKQYAGEGNYYYTVEGSDVPARIKADEDTVTISIDDIPPGEVTLGNVQNIHPDDMLDAEKVQRRSVLEQITIHAEVLTRLLPSDMNSCSPEEEAYWQETWDEIGHGATDFNNVLDEHFTEHLMAIKQTDELAEWLEQNNDERMQQYEEKMIVLANKYAHNPLALQTIYEQAILLGLDALCVLAREHALKMCNYYPVLHFSLALGSLILDERDARFAGVYNHTDIREALPGYEQYHSGEVVNFWLTRLWLSLEQKDIKTAVQYYYMLVDGKATGWLLLPVLEKYVEVLYRYMSPGGEVGVS